MKCIGVKDQSVYIICILKEIRKQGSVERRWNDGITG